MVAAYVPEFEHDVFVSYSHLDNVSFQPGGEQAGWVDTLVDSLRKLSQHKLGSRELSIWMDPRLSGNEPFPAEIQDVVCNSATLLAILSEGYLKSEWCRKERGLFLEAIKDRGLNGRIFLVHQTEIKQDHLPEELRDILGYQFFSKERDDAPVRTLGMPVVDHSDQAYFQRLDDLSRELAKKLGDLRDQLGRPDSPTGQANGTMTVFLAEVTADLYGSRDDVKRYLDQAGIRVLPANYYKRAPEAFEEIMKRDLSECVLFVQLLGPYTTPKTKDLPKGYEGLQLDLAQSANMPVLRWHSLDLDRAAITDSDHLKWEEVMEMGLEDFKQEIEKRARKHFHTHERTSSNGDAFVLLDANSCDISIADGIGEFLQSHAIGYDIIDENTSLTDLAQEEDYDALMVIYGKCEVEWAHQEVRQCRQVVMRKKAHPPVGAVYEGQGDSKNRLRIRPPRFHFISDMKPSLFETFVDAVQTRAAQQ